MVQTFDRPLPVGLDSPATGFSYVEAPTMQVIAVAQEIATFLRALVKHYPTDRDLLISSWMAMVIPINSVP